MQYCPFCGKELVSGASFCPYCGASTGADDTVKEQAYLDTTHRFLRWERKAWSISAKVYIIMGAVLAGLFLLYAMLFTMLSFEDPDVLFGAVLFFMYALIFGGMVAAIGIVNQCAANKIPQYLNSMYTDFRPTNARCGSIGMIVFCAFFNEIALGFFLANFIRIQCSKKTIQRIIARQQAMQ